MSEIDTSTAAIAALMDGVTAGPWEQDGPISAKIVWAGPDVRVCFMTSDGPASKNARFIAASRELVPALTDERDAAVARAERAEAQVAELEAEVERLRSITTRFPDHMAQIIAAKDEALDDRLGRLIAAMNALPEYLHGYQWVADEKQAFGEKYVRHVAGDNGHGMGRQWLASCPPHIGGLADYIAAANPDTIAMILADRDSLTAQARAQGMREAAEMIDPAIFDYPSVFMGGPSHRAKRLAEAIVAPILARAEEIEKEARNG